MNQNTGADDCIVIGKVLRPRGIKGELVVRILSDFPERFLKLKEMMLRFDNGSLGVRRIERIALKDAKTAHLKLEELASRSDAERIKGALIVVEKDDAVELDDDTFYIYDLIGLEVFGVDGGFLGRIKDVESYPANDVVLIETDSGDMMVPAVKEYFREIDTIEKKVVLLIPEGLPVRQKKTGKNE